MMIHAQFPQEEMEREKLVVIQEIKMYDDNPQALVSEKRNTWYTGDNPYGWTIL
jgi:predicted Zn-dependent peptidase